MNRRQILLGAFGLMLPTLPAMAETRSVRYNFNSSFSKRNQNRRSGYRGKKTIAYNTAERPGSIIVNTREKALYYVLPNGKAIRYGVGVGRQGFSWTGVANIKRKAKWPSWHPPEEMRKRELKK